MNRRKSGDDLLGVARIRAEERGGPSGIADRYEEAARAPLPVDTRRAAGGELMPAEDFAENTLPAILDTLVSPDAVAADASRERVAGLKVDARPDRSRLNRTPSLDRAGRCIVMERRAIHEREAPLGLAIREAGSRNFSSLHKQLLFQY